MGLLLRSVTAKDDGRALSDAIADDDDYIGEFVIEHGDKTISVDAWSTAIQDDDGTERFRLLALADISHRVHSDQEELERKIREKDTLLRELQHRVKNNLQMVTALIRLEARNLPENAAGERFDRLAGRVDALALLYSLLSADTPADSVDLGVYISQIASAVMKAHANEGVRLDLKVDTWPVSINVAMPTGLVVNELLTNALKHAFVGRNGGTLTLRSVVDENRVPRDRRRRWCGSSRGRGLADARKTCCADCPVTSAERRSTSHCRIRQGAMVFEYRSYSPGPAPLRILRR